MRPSKTTRHWQNTEICDLYVAVAFTATLKCVNWERYAMKSKMTLSLFFLYIKFPQNLQKTILKALSLRTRDTTRECEMEMNVGWGDSLFPHPPLGRWKGIYTNTHLNTHIHSHCSQLKRWLIYTKKVSLCCVSLSVISITLQRREILVKCNLIYAVYWYLTACTDSHVDSRCTGLEQNLPPRLLNKSRLKTARESLSHIDLMEMRHATNYFFKLYFLLKN